MAASRLPRILGSLAWLPVGIATADVVGMPTLVQDGRMAPALTPGDVALVDRLSCRLYRFRRGDVVQLKSPDDPGATVTARLVALQGDWVSTAAVPAGAASPSSAPRSRVRLEVPLGQAWVEADDGAAAGAAGAAADSPTGWGPVPLALIEGRVVGLVWPPGRAGRVSGAPGEAHGARVVVGGGGGGGPLKKD